MALIRDQLLVYLKYLDVRNTSLSTATLTALLFGSLWMEVTDKQ